LPAVRAVGRRIKRALLDIAGLYRQSLGCLTTALAMRGRSVVRLHDVVEFFCEQAELWGEEIEAAVVGRFREKRMLWDQRLEVAL